MLSLLLALPDAAANVDRKMPAKDIKTDLTIPQRHSNMERRQFVQLINLTDHYWMDVLGDELFHYLNYYDLFT